MSWILDTYQVVYDLQRFFSGSVGCLFTFFRVCFVCLFFFSNNRHLLSKISVGKESDFSQLGPLAQELSQAIIKLLARTGVISMFNYKRIHFQVHSSSCQPCVRCPVGSPSGKKLREGPGQSQRGTESLQCSLILNCSPLIYMSILVPLAHGFEYCNFVVKFSNQKV